MTDTPSRAEIEAHTTSYKPALAEGGSSSATARGYAHGDAPLPLLLWKDIQEISAPDKLVRGLFGEGKTAVCYGLPKSGKSFFVTYLAMHIAFGWSFFGRSVLRGGVLYVAAEGAAGLKNRIVGARIKHQISSSDDASVPFAIIPAAINLGPNGEDVPRVIAAAAEVERITGQPVRVIVLDTLARVMPGADENSASDMGVTVDRVERIKIETGATIIIVHHAGKAQGAGPRGSSALYGAVDTVIQVTKQKDGDRIATVEAQRDGVEGDCLVFRLEPVVIGTDDDGQDIMTAVVVPVDDPAAGVSPRRREPTGNTGVVLLALQRAIAERGKEAPTSNHIPTAVQVVSPDCWRDYAYKMMSESTPEARQKAFKRGYDSLLGSDHVCVWGDHAWMP